jgi:hypothetical protein
MELLSERRRLSTIVYNIESGCRSRLITRLGPS